MSKSPYSLWLDDDVMADLQKMADRQGISRSALVDHVLKAGLDSTGELVDALDGLSLSDLLEVLTTAGQKRKAKRK